MSQAITCLHLADIHFGVETHGVINPESGLNTRLEDFRKSLSSAIDYAINSDVDLVLFAGDAYKRNSPSPTEQREFVTQFCRLADHEIPTVMISGNHDIPVMHGKASSIDIFRSLRPGLFHVYVNQPTLPPPVIKTKKGPIAVACLPYISPSFLRNIPELHNKQGDEFKTELENFYYQIIRNMANEIDEDIPRVLLAHLSVDGAMSGGYRPSSIVSDEISILPADMANAGYDYVALGHLHRHQDLSNRADIPVVYCGSIDRIDFSEKDESKGFVVAHVERGKTRYEFIEHAVRPFVHIDVKNEEGSDITQNILAELKNHNIEGAIVRISFTAHDQDLASLDLKQIHTALQSAHFKAGIHRIIPTTENKRRQTNLSKEVTLVDAMLTYFEEHDELKSHKEALIEKAKDIENKVKSSL